MMKVCVLLLTTLALAAGCGKEAVGPAPAWELAGLDGARVRSADFAGKVVIVDFWATWCPPCRKGIPELIELQRAYGDRGLVVVGISLDEDGPEVVKAFRDEFKINYPIVMGNNNVAEAFGGVRAIPTAFVIDRAGEIVEKHVGYTAKARFEQAIKPLL